MTLFKKYLLSSVYRDKENEGGNKAGDNAGGDDNNKGGDNAGDDNNKGGEGGDDQPGARENVFQERIGELTRKRGEAERRAEAAEARAAEAERKAQAAEALLEAAEGGKKGGEGDPPARRPVARPVPTIDEILSSPEGQKAVRTAAQRQSQSMSLAERGDQLYDKGAKEHTQEKWDRALGTFKAFDGLREDVTNALLNVDNGHDVLFHLGNNPTEIARIYKLAERDPIAMATEIAKLSVKVTTTKKAVSKAPEPPDNKDTGGGGAQKKDYTDKDIPMADFVREREADLKKRGVRL